MFSASKGAGTTTAGYNAQYNPQATEDREWPRASAKRLRGPNYRPTPLRWYFIAAQIIFIGVLAGLVQWARVSMPDSDSSAVIEDKRWLQPRAEPTEEGALPVATVAQPQETEAPVATSQPETNSDPDTIVVDQSQKTEAPTVVDPETAAPEPEVSSVEQPQVTEETKAPEPEEATSDPEVSSVEPPKTDVSTADLQETEPPIISHPKETDVSTEVVLKETTSEPPKTTEADRSKETEVVENTDVSTSDNSQAAEVTTITGPKKTDISTTADPKETTTGPDSTTVDPSDGTNRVKGGDRTTTTTADKDETTTEGDATTTGEVSTTTGTGKETVAKGKLVTTTIVSDSSKTIVVPGTTGKITKTIATTRIEAWTSVETIIENSGAPLESAAATTYTTTRTTAFIVTAAASTSKATIIGTSTIEPAGSGSEEPSVIEFTTVSKVMIPGGEQTVTSEIEEVVTTAEDVHFSRPGDETRYVTHTGSTASVGYAPTVVETTQASSTYIEIGKVTVTSVYTQGARGDPAQKPITQEKPKVVDVVSVDAGETIKQVKQKDPVTYVTQVNEVETMVWAQAPETIVTEIGASETTLAVVTIGEDGLPTTTNVVSTIPGRLTTMTRSLDPTTFVSTKSGKLTTITSTPDGSTTLLSTREGTTRTFASTVTGTELASKPTDEAVESTTVYHITEAGYFLGKFLPPMLSVIMAIPLRIIDLNAQEFQPFYSLNEQYGALGKSSMTLHYSGWLGFFMPFRSFSEGHYTTFITMLITLCSSLITPLATEAIGVKVHGKCKLTVAAGCAAQLGVSPLPTHILMALLGITIVLLALLIFFLHRRETGLYANPWSIAGIASLAGYPHARPRKTTEKKIIEEMADKRYGFGTFKTQDNDNEYGIILYDDAGKSLHSRNSSDAPSISTMDGVYEIEPVVVTGKKPREMPFVALTYTWRIAFGLFLAGFAGFILYYHMTPFKGDGFTRFMNGQTFGVRFLFASVGVALSFGWTGFFISVAMITPYKVMSRPQFAADSVLLTRPTNAFSGIYSALKHGHLYPALVALMAILSQFMPILLANVPYELTQTHRAHNICARVSIGILIAMILTLLGSLFVAWPDMPVDPHSIAGAMYYISESNLVEHFGSMARLDKKDRARAVQELGGGYWYGEVPASNGGKRMTVERDDQSLAGDSAHTHRTTMSEGLDVDTSYRGYQL